MRKKNTLRNIIFSLTGQMVVILLGFASRTVFIKLLGSTYLGLNGLFDSILSFLSLAELGIGNSIIFTLYDPIAKNNTERIKTLMMLFRKIYNIIGVVVLALVLCIMPFLQTFVHTTLNIEYLRLFFLIYSTNSVSSYFFTYKRAIFLVDQKYYKVSLNQNLFSCIQYAAQVVFLIMTKNFIVFLVIQTACTFTSNIVISIQANRAYPFLKEHKAKKLDTDTKKIIAKNITGVACLKVSDVVVNGSNSILISMFIGITQVGIMSNYDLFTKKLVNLIAQIFTSVTASVGNLNIEQDPERSRQIFNVLLFVNFWIYGICSIVFLAVLNPLITLWVGQKYVVYELALIFYLISFFLNGLRLTNYVFLDTYGLYWKLKLKAIVEAASNIIGCLIFIKLLGLAGVYLGTAVSVLFVNLTWEPFVIFKYKFNKSITNYFIRLFTYLAATFSAAVLTNMLCSFFSHVSFLNLLIRFVIGIFVPNCLFLLLFFRSKEFKYLSQNVLKQLIFKLKHRKNEVPDE
jgi:O-antigen/teichoic acid export membrane protein